MSEDDLSEVDRMVQEGFLGFERVLGADTSATAATKTSMAVARMAAVYAVAFHDPDVALLDITLHALRYLNALRGSPHYMRRLEIMRASIEARSLERTH